MLLLLIWPSSSKPIAVYSMNYFLDFFVRFPDAPIAAFFFAAFFDFGATGFLPGVLVKCSFTWAAI